MNARIVLAGIGVLWGALRLAELLRYRDRAEVYRSILGGSHPQMVRPGDHWLQLATMTACWCEIALLLGAHTIVPHVAVGCLAAIFVAGRFRALQEVGHTALHLGFGTNKSIQRVFADWLGNYLLWKPDSERRFQSHCIGHHPQANTEADPNVVRLRRIGLVPGISRGRFAALVFWPLSPGGIRENVGFIVASVSGGSGLQVVQRLVVNAIVLGAVWQFAGGAALIVYAIALLFLYPLYSWWSLLVEHRWFAEADIKELSRTEYECRVARRTVYGAISAWTIRVLICPLTDSFHLAHHLYPRMHWKYIAEADRALAATNDTYARGANYGLLIGFAPGTPSALGDLYRRLVQSRSDHSQNVVSGVAT
jgi:fatty acid desaturase